MAKETPTLPSKAQDRTAAVVIEPIQGEAGVVLPPDGFLGRAREITSATGSLRPRARWE